ncbi:hypothetical protein HX882_26645 [Pseudomonas gingeri]|uniref:Uncharacterized protein n=3 Tax=Pseudomonas gingeri TaxID=117681 RepID=A0A7Y7XGY0_9PSED|nr:hypothetical protein [Pseudomonas gingeri]NWB99476.1 hypothetical protein [Pseudomonas gingeri]
MAMTALSLWCVVALAAESTVGKWYDDLGSPAFGNAVFTILNDSGTYYLVRRNGDGSSGRYRLEKTGKTYVKIGDKFGAKYLVTSQGLELHDRQGYIRTALPVE